jgi:ATP-dependent 26S proteasome regulatory subunit
MNVPVETLPPVPVVAARDLTLTPSQQALYAKLEQTLGAAAVVAVVGPTSSGRTTVITQLAERRGGIVIDLAQIVRAARGNSELRADEAIGARVLQAFEQYDLVIIDDITAYIGMMTRFVRGHMFAQVVVPMLHMAAGERGKQLVIVGNPTDNWLSVTDMFGERATSVEMPPFGPEDYAAIAAGVLGAERIAGVDFRLIHRHASMLEGHQLQLMCQLLANERELTTQSFVTCLQDWILHSNLDISEVEALDFNTLPGSEHIAEALETHVVLPFEHPELALKMGLKPKRGVLLYGPPGTGKTSIGRALAHRMKGKFFMIDGTFVTEPPGAFFGMVHAIVAEAKANSPSVLFIDDADVLFNIEHVGGLARYLLTLLDGLESETASNVCVMMTAMDVRKVPEALMRSGRVELWLETRPPDEDTRARILERWMTEGLPGQDSVDYPALARATDGFTPADLRRIAADARLLYAADIVAKHEPGTATHYLAAAISDIVAVRAHMADQLGDDTLRVGQPL